MAIPIINASILNGSNGFKISEYTAGYSSHSGVSVSNAGDVNGDGFDDVIMGVYDTYHDYGYSYVVFGKESSFDAALDITELDGSNGFAIDGGHLVSDAGDVNGDGFDDLIIGARGRYDPTTYSRSDDFSFVVFGKSSDFGQNLDLSSLDGTNGFRMDVAGIRRISVSGAGDVNGDGYDDVIIGGPYWKEGGGYSEKSASHVVFGKASRFSDPMDLSILDGSNGFHLGGVSTNWKVSSAGDVNGDGYDDLLIGKKDEAGTNGYHSGSSYVVFGKASGFSATMDLSMLDGNNGFRLDGVAAGDESGNSVSSAEDINGDGFGDLIISSKSAAYIVFGKTTGFSAVMSLSNLDGSNGFRMDGSYSLYGSSVSNAGDVNGDGYNDVIIGIVNDGSATTDASYVVFGKASGFSASIDLNDLDGSNGFRIEVINAENQFGTGSNVSGAGDVNNDGFDDLFISDPDIISRITYVIFGGPFITGEPVYLGTAGDDQLTGTVLVERFEAGDGNDTIDGLGGADIIESGSGDDTIAVADLDFERVDGGIGSDTLELTGEGINLNLASFHDAIDGIETIDLQGSGANSLALTLPSLLSLSDTTDTFTVNGDVGDRVVGLSNGWTNSGTDSGYRVFTNSGTVLRIHLAVRTDVPMPGVISLADLDGNNGFRIDGAEEFDNFGWSVSEAGDINGDGFDDVIIGAPFHSLNGIPSGASYVIFGKASGFDASLDLSDLDGGNGFRLDGITFLEHSGRSVSNAGDVNGDGFDDVIIGAPFSGSTGNSFGSSYVVFGKASGFDATLDLAVLDGNNGFRMDEMGVDDRLGYSVSNAGDVNGDGFDDVIVGAPSADPNASYSGSSYVVFGKASGFDARMNLSNLNGNNGFRVDGEGGEQSGLSVSNAGDVNDDGYDDVMVGTFSDSSYVVFGKASGFNATLDLSSLDGSNGFRLDGGNVFSFAYSGKSVSSAGDINGDGFDDVIVGSYRADANGSFSGVSYVVFGKASGFNGTLELSKLDGSNGFRIDGAASRDYLGISVSTAGDVNGDGFDDVIVGAYGADPIGYGSAAGSSYVIFGKASGFSARVDLSNFDSNMGIRLDGVAAGDRSGKPVSSAGDVNGDGFDDVMVGARHADPNGLYSGSSYVIFGRSDFGGGNVIKGTSEDDLLKGTSAAEIFEAGEGNDKMIGRGGADVFHGEAGNDYIQVLDLDFGLVDGGSGNDVLHTDGKDLNLDLTDYLDKIQGIETICLYGRGDNTLTLTGAELKQLSDTTNTLKVHGNAGDQVILEGNWVDEGSHGFYHIYTQDDAVLLVGQNLTADFV